MFNKVTFAAALSLAAFTSAPLAAATLVGETVGIDYIFGPDENSVLVDDGNGNFVVGAGAETSYFGNLEVDVSGNQLTINSLRDADFQSVEAFNGLRISDVLGAFGDFLSISLVSSDFIAPLLSFDAENLYVNFAGSGFTEQGEQVVINFTVADSVAAVPLPASLPLLLAGVGGFAALRRRRKA